MVDTQRDIFAARLQRIQCGSGLTTATLYVGMDETYQGAAVRKLARPRKRSGGRGWLLLLLAAPLMPWLVSEYRDGNMPEWMEPAMGMLETMLETAGQTLLATAGTL